MRLTSLALLVVTFAVGWFCASAPASAHEAHAITMANFAFAPAAMTIEAGDTITWTNTDQAPHDVTVTSGPAQIHSPMLMKGEHWSFTFTVAGTYSYICSIHPDMHAKVIVEAHAPVAETHSPVATASAQASRPAAAPSPHASAHATAHAHPTTSASTSASEAAIVPAAQQSPPTTSHPLKPLLLLAGLVAAVATFCLLLLAARQDEFPVPSGSGPSGDEG